MIRASRRAMLFAAAGLPLVGHAAFARASAAGPPLLLFDAATAEGRRFAEQARRLCLQTVAIEGDRVRFAAPLLARRPQAIVGVTRHADRLLIGGLAAEAGYREQLAVRQGEGGCDASACGSWTRAANFLATSGTAWPEALAALAAGRASPVAAADDEAAAQAAGWVLTRPA